MAEFILTWNPKGWPLNEDEYDERVRRTLGSHDLADSWSTGNRNSGICPGDAGFLLRQHAERGIVAAGYFTSETYQHDHWDGSRRDANYADITWTTWLPLDDRLPTEILKAEIPEVVWDRLQGSGVQLTRSAAAALDRLWTSHLERLDRAELSGPDEVAPSEAYAEGATMRVMVNRYERDPRARKDALAYHGTTCAVCGFDFEARYGSKLGAGYIHVHHVKDLATLPEGYEVDPKKDLIPVCPNCHAMLHRTRPAMSPQALKRRLRQ